MMGGGKGRGAEGLRVKGLGDETESETEELRAEGLGLSTSSSAPQPPAHHHKPLDLPQPFAEVRGLMWREEWLKSQIDVLSRQRDSLLSHLQAVQGSKATTLGHPPAKKRKVEEPGDSGSKLLAGGNWGCIREVNWQSVLGNRRKKLISNSIPLSDFPPEAQSRSEAKKRRRYALNKMLRQQGAEGLSGSPCPVDPEVKHRNGFHKEHRQNGHSAEIIQKKSGSVTNGGKKIITSTGQKVVIKFSAHKAQENAACMNSPLPNKLKKNGIARDSPGAASPLTPQMEKLKRNRTPGALAAQKGSPKIIPGTPTTPRGWDWGIDDYVYGGPRTQATVEMIKAKDIETPKWRILKEQDVDPPPVPTGKKSRSMAVGSKYAKPKPASQNGTNGTSRANGANTNGSNGAPATNVADGLNGGYLSSDENTDDETYLSRHRPYEEQEARFRMPKKEGEKGEKGEKEKVKTMDEVEKAYKSLWYRGDNAGPGSGSAINSPRLSADSPRARNRARKNSLNGTPEAKETISIKETNGAKGHVEAPPAQNGNDSPTALKRKEMEPASEVGAITSGNGPASGPQPVVVGVVSQSS